MPNYCSYSMCIKGKKENVEELIRIMNNDGDRHFCRLSEVSIIEKEYVEDDVFQAITEGYCAWSVKVCIFKNGYYKDIKEKNKEEFRETTMLIESKRLDLDVEIYSEEPGVGFQEHYVISKGILECDECKNWSVSFFDDDKTRKEVEDELGRPLSDIEWDYREIYHGGFENSHFSI